MTSAQHEDEDPDLYDNLTKEGLCTVPDQAPLRADKFLAEIFSDLSRTCIQKSFLKGQILRNGLILKAKDWVYPNEVICYTLHLPAPPQILPTHHPICVLYEDESVIAINKSPGHIVHPGNGKPENTLVENVLGYCAGKLSRLGGPLRPGVVHRLDKETSGVLLFAKTDAAYLGLIHAFAHRHIQKTYLALVKGNPRVQSGKLEYPIGRNPVKRICMQVQAQGRPALTFWQKIEASGQDTALLKCFPKTGRTHQIRVHLAAMGYPIVGDQIYGFHPKTVLPSPPRILLHAYEVQLTHPTDPKKHLHIRAPLPNDFYTYLIERGIKIHPDYVR